MCMLCPQLPALCCTQQASADRRDMSSSRLLASLAVLYVWLAGLRAHLGAALEQITNKGSRAHCQGCNVAAYLLPCTLAAQHAGQPAARMRAIKGHSDGMPGVCKGVRKCASACSQAAAMLPPTAQRSSNPEQGPIQP